MSKIGDLIKQADWKTEKHVPAITAPATAKAGELFEVTVSLGKEVAHPNTTEHHISHITLYFKPEGAGPVYQVGHYEFSAHGESPTGPNEGPVYTHHEIKTSLKLSASGTLHAVALCNIHGLWESEQAVTVA